MWVAACTSKRHRFEKIVDRYTTMFGQMVSVENCPHCGLRLIIVRKA